MAARRHLLAERRKTVGHTQEQLAELVGVERSTVVRWEAGETEPKPWSRPKLAQALAVSVDELHRLLTISDDEAQPGQRVERKVVLVDPMRRRTLVKWGLGTTAVTGLGIGSAATVGAADVTRLQLADARLNRLTDQHGGETLWQAAVACADEGHLMLEQGTYSSSVGRQLLMATARLQVCAGWLAFDAGQDEVAQASYNDALALARQADDREVEMWALANLARQSTVVGQPREALRLATAAAQAAASVGWAPRLAAVPQLRRAVASSLVADARDAARAITQARAVVDRDHDEPTEERCAFLGPAELDGIEATCALELGRASRAETLLEQALAGYESRFARNRALYRVRLARARLDMKAVDGAAEAATGALDDLSGGLASWRVSSELDAVARRLTKYPEVADVGSFLTSYRAMSTDQHTVN
jgi:DNA-binding XRE family transcriptional regulator/tetratricopeptide (TPR) repeat protein